MGNIWKRHTAEFKAKVALAAIPQAFSGQVARAAQSNQAELDKLHRQLGQVVAERDWLKKTRKADSP